MLEGLHRSQDKVTMEKPYLSVPGLDYFGYAKFHRAADPLPTHFHENCLEFVFVLKGQQIYHIGETIYPTTGGEAFLSYLEQPHSSDGNGQGVGEFYWMQLNLSKPESFLGLNRELSLDLTDKLRAIGQHVFPFQPAKEIKLLRIPGIRHYPPGYLLPHSATATDAQQHAGRPAGKEPLFRAGKIYQCPPNGNHPH